MAQYMHTKIFGDSMLSAPTPCPLPTPGLRNSPSLPFNPPIPWKSESFSILLFIFITQGHFYGKIMAHVTNFVPKLPIFSCLGSNLSSVMLSPISGPSNPFVGPKINAFQNMSSPPSK